MDPCPLMRRVNSVVHNRDTRPVPPYTDAAFIQQHRGGTLALRAVVFDYGMVLTGPQDPEAHAALLRITGLPLERFETKIALRASTGPTVTPTTKASSPAWNSGRSSSAKLN
jgi:hypothetical protein